MSNGFVLLAIDPSVPSVFKYHHLCKNNTELLCFYDENYLCICENDHNRVRCFTHDTQLDQCEEQRCRTPPKVLGSLGEWVTHPQFSARPIGLGRNILNSVILTRPPNYSIKFSGTTH